jgi:hypothetical protein
MTPDGFRRLALDMPEACEVGHMGHPDFRVGGRIFATLGHPDAGFGMLKLTPEQQEAFVSAEPEVYVPVKGGWGRGGATSVRLRAATASGLRVGLAAAWRNMAPPRLAEKHTRKPQAERAAGSPPSPRARSARGGRRVTWNVVRGIGLKLAGVEEGVSYGTPALKVQGKLIARLKEDGVSLVVRIGFLERQQRLEADPVAFYLTDHYQNYPAMLVRLGNVNRGSIRELLEQAWRRIAPKRLTEAPRVAMGGSRRRGASGRGRPGRSRKGEA